VPILASDGQFAVRQATKYIPDQRATHYWDGNAELVKGFAPILGVKKAWDVYLLYDQNAEWRDIPPKPVYFQDQLGISDESQLDADKMTDEIKRMLSSLVVKVRADR